MLVSIKDHIYSKSGIGGSFGHVIVSIPPEVVQTELKSSS